jgi:hypothetical protein
MEARSGMSNGSQSNQLPAELNITMNDRSIDPGLADSLGKPLDCSVTFKKRAP